MYFSKSNLCFSLIAVFNAFAVAQMPIAPVDYLGVPSRVQAVARDASGEEYVYRGYTFGDRDAYYKLAAIDRTADPDSLLEHDESIGTTYAFQAYDASDAEYITIGYSYNCDVLGPGEIRIDRRFEVDDTGVRTELITRRGLNDTISRMRAPVAMGATQDVVALVCDSAALIATLPNFSNQILIDLEGGWGKFPSRAAAKGGYSYVADTDTLYTITPEGELSAMGFADRILGISTPEDFMDGSVYVLTESGGYRAKDGQLETLWSGLDQVAMFSLVLNPNSTEYLCVFQPHDADSEPTYGSGTEGLPQFDGTWMPFNFPAHFSRLTSYFDRITSETTYYAVLQEDSVLMDFVLSGTDLSAFAKIRYADVQLDGISAKRAPITDPTGVELYIELAIAPTVTNLGNETIDVLQFSARPSVFTCLVQNRLTYHGLDLQPGETRTLPPQQFYPGSSNDDSTAVLTLNAADNLPISPMLTRRVTAQVVSPIDAVVDRATRVYPNPVSDYLIPELPQGVSLSRVEAIGILGQRIVLPFDGTRVDASTLSSGAYFLLVETTEGERIRAGFVKS